MFVLQQKEHPKFKRKGDDLFLEHTLSLTEALCGFQFILAHLDGRQLLIKSNPGEVIKPGTFSLCVFYISSLPLSLHWSRNYFHLFPTILSSSSSPREKKPSSLSLSLSIFSLFLWTRRNQFSLYLSLPTQTQK